MPVRSSRREPRRLSAPTVALAAACLVVPTSALAQEERVFPLPGARLDGEVSIERTLAERRSVREYDPDTLSLDDVAQLLWAAQGVTLRPPPGEPGESLRTAPSAGGRYPLETYLLVAEVDGLEPGLYHYQPEEHALLLVRPGDFRSLLARAAIGQGAIEEAPATIVLAAVYARTEGRYGGRARRYVHMEVGVVAQNVALQAVALGLGSLFIGSFRDEAVTAALELPAPHAPLALVPVGYSTPR